MPKSGYMLTWTAGYPDPNLGYPTHLPALEGSVVPCFACTHINVFGLCFELRDIPGPSG